MNLTNSTVSGNAAGVNGGLGDGGGIFAARGSSSTPPSSRISPRARRRRPPGWDQPTPSASRTRSSPTTSSVSASARTCRGAFVSEGNNLIGVVDGGTGFGAAGDQLGTLDDPLDPMLGALANNGGPTQTHALLAGSPAIDRGNNTGAPATDQRGVARPRDGDGNGSLVVDIGAFER